MYELYLSEVIKMIKGFHTFEIFIEHFSSDIFIRFFSNIQTHQILIKEEKI